MPIKPFTDRLSPEDLRIELSNRLGKMDSDPNKNTLSEHFEFGAVLSETVHDLEWFLSSTSESFSDDRLGLVQTLCTPPNRIGPWLSLYKKMQFAWFQAALRIWSQRQCPGDLERCLGALGDGVPASREAMAACKQLSGFLASAREELRILFPVQEPQMNSRTPARGKLVAAVIHVLRPPHERANDPIIQFAPWSGLTYLGEKQVQEIKRINEILVPALRSNGLSDADAQKLEECRFLVELALPMSACRYWNLNEEQQSILAQLTPATTQVEGDSLGLALAIAVWAAGNRYSIRPAVATGQLADEHGRIGNVGAIEEKQTAVETLRSKVDDLVFFFPKAWQVGKPHERVESLRDVLARPGLLTDGFDELREAFGNIQQAAGEPSLTPERGLRPAGVLTTDFHFGGSDDVETPKAMAVREAAGWMKQQREGQIAGEWSRLPVTIPVRFDTLTKLPDCLGQPVAIKDWLREAAAGLDASHPEIGKALSRVFPDAFEIALRRPRKIVFFAYDSPAIDFWQESGAEFGEYQARVKKLLQWLRLVPTESDRGGLFEPGLIMVCGDYRRKLVWEDFLAEQRPLQNIDSAR